MRKIALLAAAVVAAGLAASASAATLPAGANAGTITIDALGNITITAAPTGTYDGVEDVAYNVVNHSSSTVAGFHVTGSAISGGNLDGDGIDNYVTSAGVSLGVFGSIQSGVDSSAQGYTGYNQGLKNVYSNDTGNAVDVLFANGGVAAGDSSFISFEAPANVNDVHVSALPLPSAASAGMLVLAGAGLVGRRRTKKTA